MRNVIVITVPNQMAGSEIIYAIQDKIVSYFGTKNATKSDNYPKVEVTCEVSQEDINELTRNLNDKITLTALLNVESERVVENIINLN
jgi:hypothetical protein